MKVVCVSDLHGILPEIPECDLLLVAGDVCPVHNHNIDFQEAWIRHEFNWWLRDTPARKKIWISGNHDLVLEKRKIEISNGTYLQDSGCEFEGMKIWGTPWQLYFFGWAFNLYEDEINEKWKLIPQDTDVLVCHGPPYGIGDGVYEDGYGAPKEGVRRCGCTHLLRRIDEIRPKLVVFGHIHEGRGKWTIGNTTFVNATILDGAYRNIYEPHVLELSANEPETAPMV